MHLDRITNTLRLGMDFPVSESRRTVVPALFTGMAARSTSARSNEAEQQRWGRVEAVEDGSSPRLQQWG